MLQHQGPDLRRLRTHSQVQPILRTIPQQAQGDVPRARRRRQHKPDGLRFALRLRQRLLRGPCAGRGRAVLGPADVLEPHRLRDSRFSQAVLGRPAAVLQTFLGFNGEDGQHHKS